MREELRFITKNEHKASEFRSLFAKTRYEVIPAAVAIEEIQTEDMEALVSDKAIKAFDRIRHPLFVDHTGLYFEALAGFPGGLTELFWERLRNDRISQLIAGSGLPAVTAVTLICYCDAKQLKIFRGEIKGHVADKPRGPEGFQWDPIFIPEGHKQTFAEMGDEKNKISMRRLAIDQFIEYLDLHHVS
jgi:XTP/dITP diphosphohydrolase